LGSLGRDHSNSAVSAELMEAVAFLREHDLLDSLELLHFHLGSQISNIRNIKEGLREAGPFTANW